MKILVCFFMLLLGACSSYYSSNGEDQYLNSRNGPNLVISAPLSGANISHFYDLPSQNQNARVSIDVVRT